MDLVVFENNKPYVIDEYRQGRFDYVELASDVAETKFFQFLFDKGVVDKLAEHCPCPRQRQHVPMWVYISSQLSMRLHGSHSFHNYPFIIRSGGLIDALGPQLGTREVDEQGHVTLHCPGFNDRNLYPRQTPCDQDYLRKLARDTPPEELERWYNERAAAIFGGPASGRPGRLRQRGAVHRRRHASVRAGQRELRRLAKVAVRRA